MANNINDLFRDLFGEGSPRETSPQRAQRYMQTAQQADSVLKDLESQQKKMDQRLQSQLEEIKKMAQDIDFNAIEQQVQRDFGTAPQQAKNEEKQQGTGAQGFSGMLQLLQQHIIGQDAFLRSLIIAFKRPFVMGWPEPDGAKNAILLCGKPCTGRHFAVETMARLLCEKGVLPSDQVQRIDLSIYPTQAEEKIFLQDLYMALQGEGEVLIFDGYENCHPAFLGQLADLVMQGRIRLSTRYVLQKGRLLDAGNALTPDAVGSITPRGKYLVFISQNGEDQLAESFGAPFVNALGDICRTEAFSDAALGEIGRLQVQKLMQKSEKQLGFTLQTEDDLAAHFAKQYDRQKGLAAILEYCSSCFKALSQYKLEHDVAERVVTLYCEDTLQADFGGGKQPLLALLPGSYQGELEAVKAEMDRIIGLREIKDYIFSLEDHYKVQRMRAAQGFKTAPVSMHMIFTGNPGTGKTTIARLVSKYLKAIGVLSGGQLVEVTRADLVGKYVGHTAPLTTQVIKSAIGGVLFIDEAYSLYRGKDDSFGLEAIDTLVKGMEDNRDDLLVILAGYSKEMEVFLTANSGLRSRFPNIIEFPDYSGEELQQIALLTAKGKGYRVDEAAQASLLDYFNVIQAMESRESGNGRLARNVIERAILAQSKRIVTQPDGEMDLLQQCDFDLFE